MKALIAYFSASGITKEIALNLQNVAKSAFNELFSEVQIFEIAPQKPYSKADLDWTNENSRTTIECKDKNFRPEMRDSIDISSFEVIFIGFPVWWYTAPNIIFSFLESGDFSGKIIVPFCTSGGSEIASCVRDMQKCVQKAIFKEGRRFNFGENKASLRRFIEGLNLK